MEWWNLNYKLHSNKIKSAQKQFLLLALRNFQWYSRQKLPPYNGRLKLMNLPNRNAIYFNKISKMFLFAVHRLGKVHFKDPITIV